MSSIRPLFAACVAVWASATFAQTAPDWGNLDGILFPALTTSGAAEASYWLPNAATPAEATEALGIVYEHIPGSAGNVSIAVGLFRKQGGEFVFVGLVEGVYGMGPTESAFYPDRVEFTTRMLAENDARCCPTDSARWSVDRETLTAREVE